MQRKHIRYMACESRECTQEGGGSRGWRHRRRCRRPPSTQHTHRRATYLVGGGHDLEVAVINDQPGPAGAEDAGGSCREVGLEVLQGAKGVPDGVLQLLRGIGVKVLRAGRGPEGGEGG
jgi:hypothetical protein